ncbi:MAG: YabP/YqfC family sporulation protein [Clostridia bacterium]|nr:YabP/YqfC family sporulation protein [Clostridia bacterium]
MQENKENQAQQLQATASSEHSLTVEQRKKISMTGVESVTSFSPQQINLTLANGKLTVTGDNLKVTAFSKTSGTFSATGNILGIKYNSSHGGKLSGFFK